MTAHADTHAASHGTTPHETVSKATYFKVFWTLMVLTVLTVVVAFIDLGALNNVVALGIAGAKATLVILIFMHVRFNTPLTWVFAGAGFFWLAIMMSLTAADYVSRDWLVGTSVLPQAQTSAPLPGEDGPTATGAAAH